MNSLVKNPESSDCGISASCCDNKPSYPTLCLYDEQVKAFAGGFKLEPGKVYETTIQFKVDGWRDSDHGKSLDLCVLASGDITEEGDAKDTEAADDQDESEPVVKAVVAGKY